MSDGGIVTREIFSEDTHDLVDETRKKTEAAPAFEIHLGDELMVVDDASGGSELKAMRLIIVWLNGRRWQGMLTEHAEHKEEGEE